MRLALKPVAGICGLLVCGGLFGSWLAQPLRADTFFDQGVRFYNQRNFSAAIQYFVQSQKNSPFDANAAYYAALTYHQMGDSARAKAQYKDVITRFPSTQAAQLSAAALKQLDPNYMRQSASQSSAGGGHAGVWSATSGGGGSEDTSGLPAETRIYYTPRNNALVVNAEVGHRPIQMIFDTGAEGCVLGKNHLAQLGITPPQGPPVGYSRGVGSSGGIKTWMLQVDMKVGSIERKNFPVMVQEELPTDPLLGQSFFKDFAYTIDNGAHSIVLKRKSSAQSVASTEPDRYAVPFVREGNEMVVSVEVNGRACPMFFDTGANSSVVFDKTSLAQAGLNVPEDAQVGISTGVGGATRTYSFNVQRVKLGPVDRSDVLVHVVENAAMGRPLVGQGFYGDGWQYTIDNENKVIHFLRR